MSTVKNIVDKAAKFIDNLLPESNPPIDEGDPNPEQLEQWQKAAGQINQELSASKATEGLELYIGTED